MAKSSNQTVPSNDKITPEEAAQVIENRSQAAVVRLDTIRQGLSDEQLKDIRKDIKDRDPKESPMYKQLLGTFADTMSDKELLEFAAELEETSERLAKRGVNASVLLPYKTEEELEKERVLKSRLKKGGLVAAGVAVFAAAVTAVVRSRGGSEEEAVAA